MSDKNSTGLSQGHNSLSQFKRNFSSLVQKVFTPVKYFAQYYFVWISIVVGLIFVAIQLAGLINMGIAHIAIISAWIIGFFGIILSEIWGKSKKSDTVSIIILTLILLVIDRGMVYFAEYQQMENDPRAKIYVKQ